MVRCSAAELPAAPADPWPSASRPRERRHTSASASTRRCPDGRSSRSPVTSFGGALIGPIAASSTAACSGVITSRYSVTSADSTNGCDNRATLANRACRSSNSPSPPYRATSAGRNRRSWFGPHTVPSSSNARVTVGTASGLRRGSNRPTSVRAVSANPGDTVPSVTPAHTNPNGVSGSGSAAASGARPPDRAARATSTASFAT